MAYNKSTGIKTKADVIFYVSAIIVLIFGAYEVLNKHNAASEIKPAIRSESFVWPEGCEIKRYSVYSKISRSCAARKNIFSDYKQYNLIFHKTGDNYYRVGDDLLELTCGFFKDCYVSRALYDVFYR